MATTTRQRSLRTPRLKPFAPGTVVRWPNPKRKTATDPFWLYGCVFVNQELHSSSIKVYMVDPDALRIIPVPYAVQSDNSRVQRCSGLWGIAGLIKAVYAQNHGHVSWDDEADADTRSVFDDFTDQELHAYLSSRQLRIKHAEIDFFPVEQSFAATEGSPLDRERRERLFRVILPYALAKRSWGARAEFLACNLSSRLEPYELCATGSPVQALAVEWLYLPVLTQRDATLRGAQNARKKLAFVEGHEWLNKVAGPADWSQGLWDVIGTSLRTIRSAGVLAAIVRDNWGLPHFPQLMRAFRGVKGAQRKRLTDLVRQQVRMQPALDAGLAEQTAKAAPAFARCFVG